MGRVDRPGHLQEREPVARHLAGRVAAALGDDEDPRGKDERGRGSDDDATSQAVAGDERDHEHGTEERDKARLRVGEVEPDDEETEHREGERGAYQREPEDGQEHDNPEDEVAAVDARVLEDRRHAEERRVGVRELDVLFGEDLNMRPGLVQADRGEERGHRHERGCERAPRPVSRPCEGDDRQKHREGEEEEDELDRPRAQVLRPEEREPREGDQAEVGTASRYGTAWKSAFLITR